MTNKESLAAVLSLPIPDTLEATSIDAPIGAGRYYNAETAIETQKAIRNAALEAAAKVCGDSARDCERLAEPIAANYLYECAGKIRDMKD